MAVRITSGADPVAFLILGIVSGGFLSFGGYVAFKQSDGWQILLAMAGTLSVFWAGVLSVRFRYDETEISYRSLFKAFTIWTGDVCGMEIRVERNQHAVLGAPRFYLILRDGRKQMLNVKILPLTVARNFCAMLLRRGASVTVQDAFMAKRMAAKIFPAGIGAGTKGDADAQFPC